MELSITTYHISNDLLHDYLFTSAVIHDLVESNLDSSMYRFKSDNCTSQYKCCNLFPVYRSISMSHEKTVIRYYGIHGHGKGLVDAMSGFGVKTPLRRSIVTENWFVQEAEHIVDYLQATIKDSNKSYHLVKQMERKEANEQLKLKGCLKSHMISYFPNGEVQMKEDICSGKHCLKGVFVKCVNGKGKIFVKGTNTNVFSDEETEEVNNEVQSEFEENEIFRHTDFSDIIEIGSMIAIFSHENANEAFYICKVLDKKTATKGISDTNEHYIPAGTAYIICNYLEKVSENMKNKEVKYKLISQNSVFITNEQIFNPGVTMSKDLKMTFR